MSAAAESKPTPGIGELMETLGVQDKLSRAGKGVVNLLYGWIDKIEDPVTRRVAEFAAGILTVGAVFGLWMGLMWVTGLFHHLTLSDALNRVIHAIENPLDPGSLPTLMLTGAAIVGAGIGASMVFDSLSNKACDETVSKVQRFVVMMLVAGAGFTLFYFPSVGHSWSTTMTCNSSMLGLLLMGAAPTCAYEL